MRNSWSPLLGISLLWFAACGENPHILGRETLTGPTPLPLASPAPPTDVPPGSPSSPSTPSTPGPHHPPHPKKRPCHRPSPHQAGYPPGALQEDDPEDDYAELVDAELQMRLGSCASQGGDRE